MKTKASYHKTQHGMKIPSEVDEHIEINEMPMRKKEGSIAGAVVLAVW